MKYLKYLFVAVIIAVILAGIYACINVKETDAYIQSVDAFIQEVER